MIFEIIANLPAAPIDSMKEVATGMTKGEAVAMVVMTLFGIACMIYIMNFVLNLRLKPVAMLSKSLDEIKADQASLLVKVKSGTELDLMMKNKVLEHASLCNNNAIRELANSVNKLVNNMLKTNP